MTLGNTILMLMTVFTLAAQPPPPPGRGPGGPRDVRRRMDEVRVTGELSKSVLSLARLYLDKSEVTQKTAPFAGARFLAAADALVHCAEHQQHIAQKGGPEPPDSAEIARHIERVYFRLQQADFFVKQSADPNAMIIAKLARQSYQEALRASDSHDTHTADECAKSADELMRALESLAQSTVPPPPPPRPGRP